MPSLWITLEAERPRRYNTGKTICVMKLELNLKAAARRLGGHVQAIVERHADDAR